MQNYYLLRHKHQELYDARWCTFPLNISSVAVMDAPRPQASTQQRCLSRGLTRDPVPLNLSPSCISGMVNTLKIWLHGLLLQISNLLGMRINMLKGTIISQKRHSVIMHRKHVCLFFYPSKIFTINLTFILYPSNYHTTYHIRRRLSLGNNIETHRH